MTLLRTIQRMPLPNEVRPCVVIVDDGVLRNGRPYGTIVVDFERRHSIALLSDRSAEFRAIWPPVPPESGSRCSTARLIV
jgi:hypothetical protein